MDENRRVGFEHRFRLLHLNPYDSRRMQCGGQNKCCGNGPFARWFVPRCGRHIASPVRPLSCSSAPYADHVGGRCYFCLLQCYSLHNSKLDRAVSGRSRLQPPADSQSSAPSSAAGRRAHSTRTHSRRDTPAFPLRSVRAQKFFLRRRLLQEEKRA